MGLLVYLIQLRLGFYNVRKHSPVYMLYNHAFVAALQTLGQTRERQYWIGHVSMLYQRIPTKCPVDREQHPSLESFCRNLSLLGL